MLVGKISEKCESVEFILIDKNGGQRWPSVVWGLAVRLPRSASALVS